MCRNKNQSQCSLTDLEPPPCELYNNVGIDLLGRPLQDIQVFPTSSPILEQTLADVNIELFVNSGKVLQIFRFRGRLLAACEVVFRSSKVFIVVLAACSKA